MKYPKFLSLEIKLEEGVLLTKFLMSIHTAKEENVLKIKSIFESYGYNISLVPGEFLKIFSSDAKEIEEINEVLARAEALGLKDIFNVNLKVGTFKRRFMKRIEDCIVNNIPFLNTDNKIVSALYDSDEVYAEYTTQNIRIEDVKTAQELVEKPMSFEDSRNVYTLDAEDLMVQQDIIKTLTEINRANPDDTTLTFIISSIIAKLDSTIANDNKNYRVMGTEHIIENALQGLILTPEMQDVIQNKILNKFTNNYEEEFRRFE